MPNRDGQAVRALLRRHGFHISKSLGQNFLIDPDIPRRVAGASALHRGCGVLEIGPGIGALTAALSDRAGKVAAVELDRALLPLLAETLAGRDNVEVIWADILKLDLPGLAADKLAGLTPVVCANLPYNITTPILTALLEANCFQAITVMVQREVARRIAAPAGTAGCGAFSAYVQYHAAVQPLFDVPPDAFLPPPKVTSSVIRLLPHAVPPVKVSDPAFFFQVVRAAFQARRKTLKNSLAIGFASRIPFHALDGLIGAAGLDPGTRGERLSLSDFAALTQQLALFLQE